MSFFTDEYLEFFRELAAHNNTKWFHANKKRFLAEVKEPFTRFVEEVLLRAVRIDPTISPDAKAAIFRINRDIRFSKDKSPYKTFMAARLGSGDRQSAFEAGFYFHFGCDEAFFAGGAYRPERESIYRIRRHIVHHPQLFREIIGNPDFRKQFGEIIGDRNKVLPAEFKAAAAEQPLLYNKQFYYMTKLKPEAVLETNLAETVIRLLLVGKPFNDFLKAAIHAELS